MNPAIDKTVRIPSFVHGGLNRIQDVTLDASGKGVNVSRVIKELGGESLASGFAGGNNGDKLLESLKEQQIEADFVEINQEIRINTKIVEADGKVTELNESGPVISENKEKELMDKLIAYATENTWFVLSGSVPPGVKKTIYRDVIEAVHEKGAKVFLDADGDLFVHALEAKPDIIKPNRDELQRYMGTSVEVEGEQLFTVAKKFIDKGVGMVIVSLGEEGAIFLNKEQRLRCPAIPVDVQSTVGAGDAMVASFLYGKSQGGSMEDCARLAIAGSAGAVETCGTKPPSRKRVDSLMKKVTVINC